MPEIGEIKGAKELGKHHRGTYIFVDCLDCGKERWVRTERPPVRCRTCQAHRGHSCERKPARGAENPNWKGGRYKGSNGYIYVYVSPDDPFYCMARKSADSFGGYVMEHRLVMAQALGRPLERGEIVHHKDGGKSNNASYNLRLSSEQCHPKRYSLGYLQGYTEALKSREDALLKEIRLLQWQVRELARQLQGKLL